jgi:hypothetical protein
MRRFGGTVSREGDAEDGWLDDEQGVQTLGQGVLFEHASCSICELLRVQTV